MGQLTEDGAIFLSASVPDPSAKHFVEEGDLPAISAAVSGLLYVALGRRRLVWGGHPAITPMVWAFAEAMEVDYGGWVKLYQSQFFEDEFPDENQHFKNVVFTESVDNDLDASLSIMRNKMIDETDFAAAVFIGGMQGIVHEFELFQKKAPLATILPVISTGGATSVIGQNIDADPALATNLDYIDLFHHQLNIDPNETRYVRPSEQPSELSQRIHSSNDKTAN
tara:strand:+ start:706 stop:1377 length:672 start_codon:yes stop_codon:yes gene_type:complete